MRGCQFSEKKERAINPTLQKKNCRQPTQITRCCSFYYYDIPEIAAATGLPNIAAAAVAAVAAAAADTVAVAEKRDSAVKRVSGLTKFNVASLFLLLD